MHTQRLPSTTDSNKSLTLYFLSLFQMGNQKTVSNGYGLTPVKEKKTGPK